MDRTALIEEIYQFICENGLCAGIVKYFGTSGKVQMNFAESKYASNIEELELSVRSYNGLKRVGMDTIEQVMTAINNGTLSSVRNLGNKSCREIRMKMLEYGFASLTEYGKKQFIKNLIDINPID